MRNKDRYLVCICCVTGQPGIYWLGNAHTLFFLQPSGDWVISFWSSFGSPTMLHSAGSCVGPAHGGCLPSAQAPSAELNELLASCLLMYNWLKQDTQPSAESEQGRTAGAVLHGGPSLEQSTMPVFRCSWWHQSPWLWGVFDLCPCHLRDP